MFRTAWLASVLLVPGLIVALAAVCIYWYGDRSKRAVCIFPVLVLVGLLILSPTFPSQHAIVTKERLLFATSSDQIESISIKPAYGASDPRAAVNVTKKSVAVSNATNKTQILHSLHGAKPCHPNHPGGGWQCLLTIESGSDSVTVLIHSTGGEQNGVLIYVHSHETYGWNLGTFRCDELGPAIEAAVHNP